MVLSAFAVVGLTAVIVCGIALLGLAGFRPAVQTRDRPQSWRNYRFGFATVALVFLAFDMEMIFMYPWGVVFAEVGLKAFLDMLVFIGLLGAGIAYAWGMGVLEWE